MKLDIKKASTDVTVYIFIQDSSSTVGAGLTGLAYDSGSLVCYYVRPLGTATALTLATQTVTGAHSDGGFVEVSSANMPGVYRLDLSDAICATGVNSVVVMLKGATNMAPVVLEIQLVDENQGTVGTINSGAITAAAIATGAIDSDAVAAGAIHATALATGAIHGTALHADALEDIHDALLTAGTNKIEVDALGHASCDVHEWLGVTAAAQATVSDIASAILDNPTYPVVTDSAGRVDVAARIQKNTALANFIFPMKDSTDHVTLKTGLSLTEEVSIDGASFTALTNNASEIGSTGVYKIDLAAADLNGDTIMLKFTATGADPLVITIITQS